MNRPGEEPDHLSPAVVCAAVAEDGPANTEMVPVHGGERIIHRFTGDLRRLKLPDK
jgi:hypothetical protein